MTMMDFKGCDDMYLYSLVLVSYAMWLDMGSGMVWRSGISATHVIERLLFLAPSLSTAQWQPLLQCSLSSFTSMLSIGHVHQLLEVLRDID